MIHLNIVNGKLRDSVEDLKNDLQQLLDLDIIQLEADDNANLRGYIGVDNSWRCTENSVLVALSKHCERFKVEAEEDDFDFGIISDFIWDGRKLIRLGKNSSGSIRYIQNWNWIFED